MRKRIKDTDYLAISTRVRVLETRLIRRDRLEQMLAADTQEQALKLLQECGYPEVRGSSPEQLDAAISQVRRQTLADLAGGMPDERYLDIFRLKYDYHNLKAILKAEAMGVSPERMLMDMGRVPVKELTACFSDDELEKLPGMLPSAAAEGKKILDTTRDPQLMDMALDRWYYRELLTVAEDTGSAFLKGYIRLQIDAANLRIFVRTSRMGKGIAFLQGALFDGGSVAAESLLRVTEGMAELKEVYRGSPLESAAEAGSEALGGGALTEFEKRCDDAVSQYLAGASRIPFGEAPLLNYLAARETEYTNLRIVLLGRSSGLPADVIRSRLRESYV